MTREIITTKVRVKMDEFNQEKAQISFDYYIGPIIDEAARELTEQVPLHYLTPLAIPGVVISKSTHGTILDNIATIETDIDHYLKAGDSVVISGMTETSFNGTFTVLTIPTTKSFTFALVHAPQTRTADTGGTITPSPCKIFVLADLKSYLPVPADYLRLYEIKFPSWIVPVRDAIRIDTPAGKMQDNPYLQSGLGRPSVLIKNLIPTGGSYGKYFVCGKLLSDEVPTAYYVKSPVAEDLNEKLIDALTWLTASKMFIVNGIGDKAKITYEQYGLSIQALAKS
jgi:hypothetical protein